MKFDFLAVDNLYGKPWKIYTEERYIATRINVYREAALHVWLRFRTKPLYVEFSFVKASFLFVK